MAEDRAHHHELHDAYMRGPAMPNVDRRREVARIEGMVVLESAPSDPPAHMHDFAELAMVAHREHSEFKAGYYGDPDEATVDRRAYAVLKEDRAVALAFTQCENRWWPGFWAGEKLYLAQREAETAAIRSLQRVWIAASERRQGLATQLIKTVADRFGVAPCDLAWEAPFTDDGRALLQSICPRTFRLEVGDMGDLRRTIARVRSAAPEE